MGVTSGRAKEGVGHAGGDSKQRVRGIGWSYAAQARLGMYLKNVSVRIVIGIA